jgi:sodium/potassium-transporting ATPase subunit alpha
MLNFFCLEIFFFKNPQFILLFLGLKVEQSALNGESEPVEVSQHSLNPHPIESRNIIFNGCLCLEGSATGVVIRTGDETFLGLVAQQTSNIEVGDTPLQRELKRFIAIITVIAIAMAVAVFVIGVGRNPGNALKYFVNGFIIIIIANVPQVRKI